MNKRFPEYFHQHGIIHGTSCPQTPQQNGIAKRKNGHTLEIAHALLLEAHVFSIEYQLKSYILRHQYNIFPHMSSPSILMIPPKFFVCVAFVHLHRNQHTKLDPCAIWCLFLGYASLQKGYFDGMIRLLNAPMLLWISLFWKMKLFTLPPSPILLFKGRSKVQNIIGSISKTIE